MNLANILDSLKGTDTFTEKIEYNALKQKILDISAEKWEVNNLTNTLITVANDTFFDRYFSNSEKKYVLDDETKKEVFIETKKLALNSLDNYEKYIDSQLQSTTTTSVAIEIDNPNKTEDDVPNTSIPYRPHVVRAV